MVIANNYLHICDETKKCNCGWKGCFCQTKSDSKKISDKVSEHYQLCPKCNSVVSISSQIVS